MKDRTFCRKLLSMSDLYVPEVGFEKPSLTLQIAKTLQGATKIRHYIGEVGLELRNKKTLEEIASSLPRGMYEQYARIYSSSRSGERRRTYSCIKRPTLDRTI